MNTDHAKEWAKGDGIPAREAGNDTETPATPFPIECLGETLATMGRAVCATERVPESLVGCCLLGFLSASLGSRLQVQSGPNRVTRGNLYILGGAVTGSGKSLTYHHIAEPFEQFETARQQEWRNVEMPGLLGQKELVEADIARIKKDAMKSNADREAAVVLLQKLKAELQTTEDGLIPPAFSCEDTSTEKLAMLLDANDEQLASMSADARGPVDNVLGRYTRNKATDEAIYLKAYSGDRLQVERVSRPPIILEEPCMTVLWLVQPDKVALLFASQSLSEGGLLPRFLMCHTNCEPQEIGETTPAIPQEVMDAYGKLIRELLNTFRVADCLATIQPAPETLRLLNDHFNSIVRRRQTAGDLQDIQGYAARWNEQAWRISVCLHAAKYASQAAGHLLELETAQRAIAIADWFAVQQLEILREGRERGREMAQRKAEGAVFRLLDKYPEGITARDVTRARIKPDTESCRALLAAMEASAQLVGEDRKPEGGGPATRVYCSPMPR